MQLNPAQEEAVLHTDGPLVVFAGAGSGKTRVITYRIANLIAHHRVPPFRILAVTFTNKAAAEMRQRLESLAGQGIAQELWVGTFHAICCRLLRRYHAEVGLSRNFVIYDDADQKSLMARLIRDRKLDDREFQPKQVLGRIHKQKQEGRGPHEVPVSFGFSETQLLLFQDYEAALKRANAVDFDDLLLHVMRLAEHPENPAGAELRARFDHVLVDEFQDTNAVQYRLVRALARARQNLCVVGDDDQSIYSWRGADVRNIRGFRKDFPNAKIVKLEQNYRSTGNIVAAATAVISAAADREPKKLWTAEESGDAVTLVMTNDEREEAAHVVKAARAALARGLSADEIAVFYRINAQSRVFEEAFRSAGLPYQIVGGMRFFERAEVKDALAYLRLIENPQSDADFLRVINVPTRGIGDKTVQHLLDLAFRERASLWGALGRTLSEPGLAMAAKKKLEAFRSLIEGLRGRAQELSPRSLAEAVLDLSGYKASLEQADSPEADARLENLAEFVGSLSDYEQQARLLGETPSVAGYLERVSLVSDIDSVQDQRTVLLMTVHAAKGLEFDTVFLTGLEEEMLPYRGVDGSSPEELEEERRLAYVAITRARRKLIVSHAAQRTLFGYTRYMLPSRFLRDLPAEVTESVSLAAGRGSFGSGPNRYGASGPVSGYRAAPAQRFGPAPAVRDEFDQRNEWEAPPAQAQSKPLGSGRHVEYDADAAPRAAQVHKGSRVHHQRFGQGTVLDVVNGDQPRVLARFAGWGERRVLLSALRVE